MKKILFVCTGNSCRSVMAEGLFRQFTEHRPGEFSVMSAGISAIDGYPASEETMRVMQEAGVDVTGHASQLLRPEMVRGADKIYVMENLHRDWIVRLIPEAESKVHLLSEFSGVDDKMGRATDIPDPIRMTPGFYDNVLEAIRRCVKNVVESL